MTSRSPWSQGLRFLAVGVLNTAVGYSIYAACLWVGLHYAAAVLVGTILGTIFNFFTSGRFVFGNTDLSRIIPFVLVYGILYVVNVAQIGLYTNLGVDPYTAGIVALFPNTVLAFVFQRMFVFRQSGETA